MLIAFITYAFVILAVFLFGICIGYQGRERLRLEVADLKGRYETLLVTYQQMRELAGRALGLAHEKHFPSKVISPEQLKNIEEQFKFNIPAHSYFPPHAKNCPECSVSVRSDDWPQECPACGCTFGFD